MVNENLNRVLGLLAGGANFDWKRPLVRYAVPYPFHFTARADRGDYLPDNIHEWSAQKLAREVLNETAQGEVERAALSKVLSEANAEIDRLRRINSRLRKRLGDE